MSHQGDVGWVGQPLRLRNLRVGSVAVSEVGWPPAHSSFFKRYRLGWDAELGERFVVISPLTNPWHYGESALPQRSLKFIEMLMVFVAAVFHFNPGWRSAQSPGSSQEAACSFGPQKITKQD